MSEDWEKKKKEWFKNYYLNNKKRFLEKSQIQYTKRKEENSNYCKDYYQSNKEKLKKYSRDYNKKKKEEKRNNLSFKKNYKSIIIFFD